MGREVVIALDQGSGSSRALAFDSGGRVVARARVPLRTRYPRPGWVEHDPEELAAGQERALDAVLDRLPRAAEVAAAGLASQRSTVVLWDGVSGRPLAPALSWMDGRAAAVARDLAERNAEVYAGTGLYLTPYYSAPKLRWLLERRPNVRRAMERGRLRIGPVATYLLWRLTRGEVFATDPTLAQRTLLFDIGTLDWDPRLLALFGVDRNCLPKVTPSAGEWGSIKRRARTVPVRAVLGDQQSAVLGLGAEKAGAGVLNYGTGAFFLLNTGTERRGVPGLLTSVAWQRRGEPCRYLQEGTVHAAGTSFDWLRDNLGLLGRGGSVDAACRRSGRRLLALQAIGGLGAPRWDYSTPTVWAGLDSGTRPEDVVRAVTESVAFLLADIISACRAAGLRVERLEASGGLSRVDYLLRFQAGLLQTAIRRSPEKEATALGAASLAAAEAGVPFKRRTARGRTFRPGLAPEEADRLLKGWRLFVETQQGLSRELRKLGIWGG